MNNDILNNRILQLQEQTRRHFLGRPGLAGRNRAQQSAGAVGRWWRYPHQHHEPARTATTAL